MYSWTTQLPSATGSFLQLEGLASASEVSRIRIVRQAAEIQASNVFQTRHIQVETLTMNASILCMLLASIQALWLSAFPEAVFATQRK